MRTGTGTARSIAAVVAAILLLGPALAAETETQATITQLRAAFLFNFAKFMELPPGALPHGTPMSLCVVEDERVADALEQMVKGHAVANHPLAVQRRSLKEPLHGCHLVFASGLDSSRSAQVVDALAGIPALSVGDSEAFARAGGMAYLYVEDGRMRFGVNVEAAQRAGVQLSSRLLVLARIVKGGAR